MIYFQQVIRTRYILFLLMPVCLLSCGKSVNFIKLDAPVTTILPDVMLTVPELTATEQGHPIEFVIGNEKNQYQSDVFYGQSGYKDTQGELQTFDYLVHFSDVVQTDKYIFVPVGYSWGGTGLFYYLTAIDKLTLVGVNSAYIGDRVKIVNLKVIDTGTDTVAITYIEHYAGNTYPSEKKRIKRLAIDQNMQMILYLD